MAKRRCPVKFSLFVAIGLTFVGCLVVQARQPVTEALKTFMRAKLSHSQKVLEGLVEEDYPKIAKNAQEMSLLSLAETWQVLNTPEYVDYSRKFRNSADKLAETAKQKDLAGATKAFNEVTTKCVECHKYVRGVRMAKK